MGEKWKSTVCPTSHSPGDSLFFQRSPGACGSKGGFATWLLRLEVGESVDGLHAGDAWLLRLDVGESVDGLHAGDACIAAQVRALPVNEGTSATAPL